LFNQDKINNDNNIICGANSYDVNIDDANHYHGAKNYVDNEDMWI